VRKLAARGADVNARQTGRDAGTTPFLLATKSLDLPYMHTLLELGADPTATGGYGGESHGLDVTPLHLAGTSGDEETVRALLDAGARTDVLDGHGYGTPASWARHAGQETAARVIEGG
jgi:ankyrin repeat protein